ncbi:hypothetical protein GTA08_BOTSDO03074 [Botryosphaeria dothidea]|uniref:Uncharacterized protein n=1 Tax=Botryosphaeria dothidea TaxID=55169 RepID=A0A8H4IZJ3_9PEZI|nr:hypothetical protein GTA08_BOTSDO03074 [Botryosphaeria dothidea]
MAPTYSTEALNSLSDVEKQRIVLAYLHHHEPRNVDWAAAAVNSGSKSTNSFKVMFGNTMKKLQARSEGAAGADNAAAASPKASHRKRGKAATEVDDDEENAPPKKRGRKKAKKSESEEVEDAMGGAVKAEPASESFFDAEEP